jgi:sensor histidine kinase regulating citrate/malate metabolism
MSLIMGKARRLFFKSRHIGKLSRKYNEIKRNNEIYKLELDLYREHIREKEKTVQEFRKAEHDFKYKLVCLKDYAQRGAYEELNRYIDSLLEIKSTGSFSYVDTDNPLIDTLLNFKYELARQHNITFNIEAEVPNRLPFDDTDLCIILGNSIDNAIEANDYVSEELRFIKLTMKYENGNLIIIMENAFDGNIIKDRHGHIISRKEDKNNHGIGLNSIKHSLDKYNGYMDIKLEYNVYILKLIMYSK